MALSGHQAVTTPETVTDPVPELANRLLTTLLHHRVVSLQASADHLVDASRVPSRTAARSNAATWYLVHHVIAATAQALGTVVVADHLHSRTASTAWVAAAAAGRLVPYLMLSGFAGAIADRHERRAFLLASTWLRALLVGLLAVSVAVAAPPLVIVALLTAATAAGTGAYPAVAASIAALSDVGRLHRAGAALNLIETAAWLVGPALGGALIVVLDPSTALAINALMFACAGLLLVPAAPVASSAGSSSTTAAVLEGVRAVRDDRRLARCLAPVIVVNVMMGLTAAVLPRVADDLVALGDAGYGTLAAVIGAGGFAAVLVTGRLSAIRRQFRCLWCLVVAATVPYAVVAAGGPAPMTLCLLFGAGAAAVTVEVLVMTTLLRLVPNHLAARVIGLVDCLLVGALVIGAALAPLLTAMMSVRAVLVTSGLALPLVGVVGTHWRQSRTSRSCSAVRVVSVG